MSRARRRRDQQLNALEDELFATLTACRRKVADEDARRDDATAIALAFCAAVWPTAPEADEALTRWRAERAAAAPVVAELRDVPLAAWRVTRPGGGARPVLAHPIGEEGAGARLNALLLVTGEELREAPERPVAGWLLERDVLRVLLVFGPLPDEVADGVSGEHLVRAATQGAVGAGAHEALWPWVAPRPRATPAPTSVQRVQPDAPPPITVTGAAAIEVARVREEAAAIGRIFKDRAPGRLVHRAELIERVRAWLDRRPGTLELAEPVELAERAQPWWREVVARARCADDLQVVRALASASRDLHRVHLHHCAVDYAHFERELPADELLEVLCGVRPDASLPGAPDDDALRHAPCTALHLAADHPVFVELDPGAPIHAALRWAAAHPGQAADAITTALDPLRAEQRWLATWGDGFLLRSAPLMAWDHLAHALHHLFDPALRAQPLSALDLPSRYQARIDPLAARLDELPVTALELRTTGAVGDKTLHTLVEHLAAHMRTWRGPLQTGDTTMAHRDEVQGGLDSLAALFAADE